jgi:hypothetical protein
MGTSAGSAREGFEALAALCDRAAVIVGFFSRFGRRGRTRPLYNVERFARRYKTCRKEAWSISKGSQPYFVKFWGGVY